MCHAPSLSRVRLFVTPCPPGSSIHGILQVRILEWVALPSPRHLPNPGIKPRSLALQMDPLLSEPPGKPRVCIKINDQLWLIFMSFCAVQTDIFFSVLFIFLPLFHFSLEKVLVLINIFMSSASTFINYNSWLCLVAQSYPTLCDPM